jgi:ubiquinone/menaquinone biosynthesis C-methylase UbiE
MHRPDIRVNAASERERATFFAERRISARYDDAYDRRNADGHALRSRLETVLRLLGAGPGDLLDAGMGPGRLCAALAERGWSVSGIDLSPEMVEIARRRLPEAAARLLHAQIEELPFPSESFDAVVATGALEYSDFPRALGELVRVLRPGGYAAVSYPNPEAFYAYWKVGVYYPAVSALKRLLRRPRRELPQGATIVPPPQFRSVLASFGLEPLETCYTSYLVIPSPLEDLVPGLVVRLGRRLEGSGSRAGRRLATQVVYLARKP